MQVTQKMINDIFDYVYKIPFDTVDNSITFSYTEDGCNGDFLVSLLKPGEMEGLTTTGIAMELGFNGPEGSEVDFSRYTEADRQQLRDSIQRELRFGALLMHAPYEGDERIVFTLNTFVPVDLVTIHQEYDRLKRGMIWCSYEQIRDEWLRIFPLIIEVGQGHIGGLDIGPVLQEPVGRC